MMWRMAILMKINWTETSSDKAVDKVILLGSKWKLQQFKSWTPKVLTYLALKWGKRSENMHISDIGYVGTPPLNERTKWKGNANSQINK